MAVNPSLESEAPFAWKVDVAASAPQKRYGVFAAAAFAGAIGLLILRHPIFALIGIIAILGATMEFWAPVRCVLDEKGASSRCGLSVSAIEWSDIKRAIVFEKWVVLSPMESDSRLSEFRGVKLWFGQHKEAILAKLEAKLGASCLIFGPKS